MQVQAYQIGKQRAFTIIELMLVLAVISILALIALPSYQDYAVRAKIAEGLVMSGPIRANVMDYYHNGGESRFPDDNAEAGIVPTSYRTNIVDRIDVGTTPSAGTITITYQLTELGSNNQLQLIPTLVGGAITWLCRPAAINGLSGTRVPSDCRN
jgi:type IV pilus assembly protein PilA